MRFYCEEAEAVLRDVDSTSEGLTSAEAEKRLAANGKNKLAEGKKDSLIKRFFQQMGDPMIIILLVAAAISGVLAVVQGESFADVIIILAVVIINAVLGVYQESKAEKAIEALQQMSAATSKVLRDGKMVTIHSEDLVVGDVVILEAGDAIPADGRILTSASMKIEEAALTGESVPVSKFIDIINLAPDTKDVPLGDRKNMVYMGSTVVYGRGTAVITATGIGFAYNVVLSTVQAWFPDKKGTCSGALLMGFGASSLVLGSLADALIQNPAVGWRAAFLCLGVAIGIVLVAAALLIRLPAPGTVLPQPKAAANRVQEDFEAAVISTEGSLLEL